MDEMAPEVSPSVIPTESHESTAAEAETAMKAGETPPVLEPNGAASW